MAQVKADSPEFSNGRLTSTNLMVLGKNLTTSVVSLYVLAISKNENLSNVNKRFLNSTTEDNYVYDSTGALVADLTGQESAPASEISFTFNVDWNGKVEGQKYGQASNIYEAMIMGQSFKHGADTIIVVGTVGSRKSGKRATACEMNKDYGKFFKKEYNRLATGLNTTTGETSYINNMFLDKAKMEANTTFAIENYTLMGNGKTSSLLFPALYTTNVGFSQADDGDTYTVPCMNKSDVWESENSLIFGARKDYAVGDTGKEFLEVDYIIVSATAPTDFSLGKTICLINPTTKAFTIQTGGASAWTINVAGTFNQFATISANKFSSSTLALATDERVFATVDVADATNGGFAVDYDDSTVGVFPALKAYTLNRTTQLFESIVNVTC